jgi:nitrous oxidase accessory protein NosD
MRGEFQCEYYLGKLVVMLASSLGPSLHAADLCGSTIVNDLKLEQDPVCAVDGITVGADGIKVNLNGHTIPGAGAGIGIRVCGRTDVSVRNGTIRNFVLGIFVSNSNDIEIKETFFTQNREGVFLAGSVGGVVKENGAWSLRTHG